MDIQKRIDELSAQTDELTRAKLPTRRQLRVIGSRDSVFLRNTKRKADTLGIPCEFYDVCQYYDAIVVDQETRQVPHLPAEADIDHSCSEGLSCVAEAVLMLLHDSDYVWGEHIVIVGRGHAVQGLPERLLYGGATVSIVHTGTPNKFDVISRADVVIYATPAFDEPIYYCTPGMVIDLGNVVPEPELFSCPYTNRIGKLTVSILLNRFVNN